MKKLVFIFFVFLLQTENSNAQDSTYFWKSYVDEDVASLGISGIEDSNCSTHYRIWTSTQLVDLCKESDSLFTGQVISFLTKEYKKWGKKKSKMVSETIVIPDSISQNVFASLQTNKIETLPDSKELDGYPTGLDGNTYIFEVKKNQNYRIYSYWEPLNDRYTDSSVPEIASVRSIITEINSVLNLGKTFEEFKNKLPKGLYSYGGIYMYKIE